MLLDSMLIQHKQHQMLKLRHFTISWKVLADFEFDSQSVLLEITYGFMRFRNPCILIIYILQIL